MPSSGQNLVFGLFVGVLCQEIQTKERALVAAAICALGTWIKFPPPSDISGLLGPLTQALKSLWERGS